MNNLRTSYLPNLRILNLIMAVSHLSQAIIFVLLSQAETITIYFQYLKVQENANIVSLSAFDLVTLDLALLLAAVTTICGLSHLIISLPKVYPAYLRMIDRKVNYIRWLEYSFSATLMILIIAIVTGIREFHILLAIGGLNIGMVLSGILVEITNRNEPQRTWIPFSIGSFLGMIPWIIIFSYFFIAIHFRVQAPTYLYSLIFTIFFLFNIFGLNMYLTYKKIGLWSNYEFSERMFIFLSIFAKSALAWQIFLGTLI
jgi:hypothetical protein